MFKEAEPGQKEVNAERTVDILDSGAEVVASACPFCMTMLEDGIKTENKEGSIKVLDLAELIANGQGL
jgi:Fe-S oxidoreductase